MNSNQAFLSKYLSFWDKLSCEDKDLILNNLISKKFAKSTQLFYGATECAGLELVKKGRARVYLSSEDGREITLFRLLDGDICILSAACMFENLDFDVNMEIECDSEIVILPKNIIKKIMDNNIHVKNFTIELISNKFSDVVWLMGQVVFLPMSKRLASSLIEEKNINNSCILKITHEQLAKDLGSAREVVSRLLKKFESDDIVKLNRGKIEILNFEKLNKV